MARTTSTSHRGLPNSLVAWGYELEQHRVRRFKFGFEPHEVDKEVVPNTKGYLRVKNSHLREMAKEDHEQTLAWVQLIGRRIVGVCTRDST